jgi:hypothetical protein
MITITSTFPILMFLTILFVIFFICIKLDIDGLTEKKILQNIIKKINR